MTDGSRERQISIVVLGGPMSWIDPGARAIPDPSSFREDLDVFLSWLRSIFRRIVDHSPAAAWAR